MGKIPQPSQLTAPLFMWVSMATKIALRFVVNEMLFNLILFSSTKEISREFGLTGALTFHSVFDWSFGLCFKRHFLLESFCMDFFCEFFFKRIFQDNRPTC